MSIKWRSIAIGFVLAAFVGAGDRVVAAGSSYVSATGSDSNSGSQGSPFLTIQGASKHATSGTTVHVAAGTYYGGFVTAASGTAAAPIIYVSDVPGAAKIVGGQLSNANGAGWWNSGSYVTISGFTMDGSNSQAAGWRNGIYNSGSFSIIQHNTVHDICINSTTYSNANSSGLGGAGIQNDGWYGGTGSSIIGNIVYNVGPAKGISYEVHGLYEGQAGGAVTNNVVKNVIGDGIALWHSVQHNDIFNNTIDGARHAGITVGSGDSGSSATTGDYINVDNNIVVNSQYSIEEGGTTGVHNTYVDNLFYNDTYGPQLQHGLTATGTVKTNPQFVNATARDYHLQATSPAIDTGTLNGAPETDIAGTARPQGAKDDIGAYEATSTTTGGGTISTSVISLSLSEDAYAGNAQFIIKVDGRTIGGPTAVLASHAVGAHDTFTYTGSWAVGQHDLEIDFVNDAWGGTPTTDRNLYVDQVNYKGVNYLSSSHPLYSNGAFHIPIQN